MSSRPAPPDAPDSSAPLLRVTELRKAFFMPERRLEVLKGIELVIERQEMLSLVGHSGVGKSTFLHIIGTLDRPTSGRVLYEGQDVLALPEPELAAFRNRAIGFVFQFHHLLPEFTALENAMMPALIHRDAPKVARDRAVWLLDRVGLGQRLKHRPGELSGGEQQRVAIARSLVMDPRLVLADEPTGNLDQHTSGEIHDLLLQLNQDTGIAFLVATHNYALALQMRRHLILREGVIEEMTKGEAEAHAALARERRTAR